MSDNLGNVRNAQNECDRLESENNGDHLTSLVVNEARTVMEKIDKIPNKINDVKRIVEAKREQLRQKALEQKKEKNKDK